MYFLWRIVSFKKTTLSSLPLNLELNWSGSVLNLIYSQKNWDYCCGQSLVRIFFFYQIRIQPGLEKLFRSDGSRSATLDVPLHVAAPAEEVVIERVAPLVRLIRQLHLAYLHTHNTERLGIQTNTKKISKSQKKTFPPISPFTEQIWKTKKFKKKRALVKKNIILI